MNNVAWFLGGLAVGVVGTVVAAKITDDDTNKMSLLDKAEQREDDCTDGTEKLASQVDDISDDSMATAKA